MAGAIDAGCRREAGGVFVDLRHQFVASQLDHLAEQPVRSDRERLVHAGTDLPSAPAAPVRRSMSRGPLIPPSFVGDREDRGEQFGLDALPRRG